MSEHEAKQATPAEELERQIISALVPKNEREWWAQREIERLKTEIGRAYRALHGFANAHKRGEPLGDAAFAYHSLTIAAARRFVKEGFLDGADYFLGKPVEELHRWLFCAGDRSRAARTTDKVFLRCEFCGNAKIVPLEKTDPPGTVSVVTNECDICNAASGGFGECWYYDQHGRELAPT